jgi:hypothetical protein
MKNDKEILDFLGQKIVENCYDGTISHFISIRKKIVPPIIFKEKADFLKSLSSVQFEEVKKIIGNTVEIAFAEFFNILDENPTYKIIYEKDGQQVDLNKISEMLKAELFIENGWIERFSKFENNEQE